MTVLNIFTPNTIANVRQAWLDACAVRAVRAKLKSSSDDSRIWQQETQTMLWRRQRCGLCHSKTKGSYVVTITHVLLKQSAFSNNYRCDRLSCLMKNVKLRCNIRLADKHLGDPCESQQKWGLNWQFFSYGTTAHIWALSSSVLRYLNDTHLNTW
jgi:hypothetical protein